MDDHPAPPGQSVPFGVHLLEIVRETLAPPLGFGQRVGAAAHTRAACSHIVE
jgi:hypothetical protein